MRGNSTADALSSCSDRPSKPTPEEKDNAIDGRFVLLSVILRIISLHVRWVREGLYKFNFELRKFVCSSTGRCLGT